MSRRVNVLLLLSALLSALTGLGGTVRAPQPAVLVQQARTSAPASVRTPLAQRPAVAPPQIAAVAARPTGSAVQQPARAPLYLARLRV